MAKPAAKAVIAKKKIWVPIKATKLFSEQVLGESFVEAPEQLMGRVASVSLMILTGDPQKQTVSVSFKVTGVTKEGVTTELIGYKLLQAAAKKLMRRKRDKIEDSFIVVTKDGKIIRIKPLVITRGSTTGSVMATMRRLERAYVAKVISTSDFDAIVTDIVTKKFQHGLGMLLRHLYPIGACEIRQFELIAPEKVKELGLKITLPPEKLPEFKTSKKEEPKQEQKTEQPATA